MTAGENLFGKIQIFHLDLSLRVTTVTLSILVISQAAVDKHSH